LGMVGRDGISLGVTHLKARLKQVNELPIVVRLHLLVWDF